MITQLQTILKIINSKDYSIVAENNLNEEFFPNYKKEFKFISDHYNKYGCVPDEATFFKTFPEVDSIQVNESNEYLVKELYRKRNESFLAKTFNKIKDLLVSGKTEEAMDIFYEASHKTSENKKLDAIDILKDTSRYDRYIEKCNDFNRFYLSTGFKELDESLGGGIDRLNSYFVISARPGIGKTLIMIKFASAAVSKGLRVGFYEGEMSIDKVAGRYDTIVSHTSNGAITHGNINVANQYKSYLEKLKDSKGSFFILTRDMVPDDRVTTSVLGNFIDKYNLDVLFVDQLSLLDSNTKNIKPFEQMAEISKSLKNLQVRKKIPIIVASQLNRGAADESSIAGTENIAGSDRISADASEIICLKKKDDILTIDIAKARDGAQKYKLKYSVDFDKGIFNYIPDDDDEDYNNYSSSSEESDVF